MGIWHLFIPLLILALPFLLTPIRKWIVHVLVSLALVGAYIYALIFISEVNSGLGLVFGLLVFVPLVVTAVCYATEDEKREGESESFYDRRLFYKYGVIVKRDVIPIGTSDDISEEEMGELINKFYTNLFKQLDAKFQNAPNYFRKIIRVSDSNKAYDSRYFIKIIFDTLRGSSLTNMINSKKIGNQIAITSLFFIRCTPPWHIGLLFVCSAPFHYWFWIYHWVFKKFSIVSFIGKNITNNSFDIIDIEGYLKSVSFTLLSCIETFAKENGLFTEELKQVIVQQINNTQSINIAKSRGIKIGNVEIASQKLKK